MLVFIGMQVKIVVVLDSPVRTVSVVGVASRRKVGNQMRNELRSV